MENTLNNRIEELEIKIAFQEQTIEELNQTIIHQSEDIKALKTAITLMSKKIKQLDIGSDIETEISRPPHY